MKRFTRRTTLALGLLAAAAPAVGLFAADRPAAARKAKPAATTPKGAQDPAARAQALIDKGLAFLKTQQKPDGGWQGEKDPPALTALVLRAFVRAEKYDADTDFVQKGYDKLLTYQVEDGGIYKDLLANYNT